MANYIRGTIGEYNVSTGAVVNSSLITGLSEPLGLALSGNDLFVANYASGVVGEYNATTGAAINANFITGLSGPAGLAVAAPPPCTLTDTLSYDAATSTLTMNFTIGNASYADATWNAWLNYQNSIESVFSTSEPITNPPVPVTKTATLSPEGIVGVLSTLTTPTKGIVCSSWVTTNTGTP